MQPTEGDVQEEQHRSAAVKKLVPKSLVNDFLTSLGQHTGTRTLILIGDTDAAVVSSSSASKRKLDVTETEDASPAMKRHKSNESAQQKRTKRSTASRIRMIGTTKRTHDKRGNLVLGSRAFFSDTDDSTDEDQSNKPVNLMAMFAEYTMKREAERLAVDAPPNTEAGRDKPNLDQAAEQATEEPAAENQGLAHSGEQAIIVHPEVENEATVQQGQPTLAETLVPQIRLPETPRNTRRWGLGSLMGSVSRFVPNIPTFRRTTASQVQANTSQIFGNSDNGATENSSASTAAAVIAPNAVTATVAPAPAPATEPALQDHAVPTIRPTGPMPAWNAFAPKPGQSFGQLIRTTPSTHRQFVGNNAQTEPRVRKDSTNVLDTQANVTRPESNYHHLFRDRRLANQARKKNTERQFLESQQKLIDDEVARKVKEALEEHERLRTEAEKATVPGTKRKRLPSPDVIPNPPGCSYGMDLNYFGSDSSEDELGDNEVTTGQIESPSTRPMKRARMSSESQASSSERVLGDPHRAPPYTGKMFADPKPNLFFKPVAPSRTFTTPEESDSEGDADEEARATPSKDKGKTKETASTISSSTDKSSSVSNVTSGPGSSSTPVPPPAKASVTWKQPPPPAPRPSHMELPSSSDAPEDLDPLSQARARALQHTPKQPSRLKFSSRLSSSTVATPSDIGFQNNSPAAMSPLNNEQSRDALDDITESQNQITDDSNDNDNDVAPQLGPIDAEVQQAVDAIPADQLLEFDFPAPSQSYADMGFDPEVVAAVMQHWTPNDTERAHQMFEADFNSWKQEQATAHVAGGSA